MKPMPQDNKLLRSIFPELVKLKGEHGCNYCMDRLCGCVHCNKDKKTGHG